MKIVIVGNGISGITAARFIRKLSDHEITVVSRETDFFFSRTALMYIYMGHMRYEDTQPYEPSFWAKNRIELVRGEVSEIDSAAKKLLFRNVDFPDSAIEVQRESLPYDVLILATGSVPNKYGWKGQELDGVGQLYSFQDLEYLEEWSPRIHRGVIVGGGLIGIELAEMLHSRNRHVTMLVREDSYWNNVLPAEESAMITEHILEHGIDLRLGEELDEIVPDDLGQAKAVRTKGGDQIDCEYVGLTAGVRPNILFLQNSDLEINRGILVDEFLRTNIPDVYAIGDCAELRSPRPGRRSTEAVWYTGRMMGETVAYTICGKDKAYDPGIWFNSAKFLDIEYQVYGDVPTQLSEDQDTLFWASEDRQKCIRINYHRASMRVTGFNLLGIRFRHEVCEKWLRDETPIGDVLDAIEMAFFDPEFVHTYAQEIREVAAQKLDIPIAQPSKGGSMLRRVLSFLEK